VFWVISVYFNIRNTFPCFVPSCWDTLYISNKMQRYTVNCIWKLLYMFRVVPSPFIRSANNCIYSIWYLSHRYCYLPLSWKCLNRFDCAVGGVRHPLHSHTGSNSSTIAADSSNGVTNNGCRRYSCLRSWWRVMVPPETCRAVSR
jgi:hypothetical protein